MVHINKNQDAMTTLQSVRIFMSFRRKRDDGATNTSHPNRTVVSNGCNDPNYYTMVVLMAER